MKKTYIQPETTTLPVVFAYNICVGSVHGNSGFGLGGSGDPTTDPDQLPL